MDVRRRHGRTAVRWIAALVAVLAGVSGALADPVAITGAVVHPVSVPAITDGVIVMDEGLLAAVGPAGEVEVPPGAEVVDARGLHAWPGMIDAFSRIGLVEIGSVRGTLDLTESGQMNPNARAEVAINASSSHIPVTRANGVLLAATVPSGSMVPGTSAVITLDGWTWEEMVRFAPAGLMIEWPGMAPSAAYATPEQQRHRPEREGERPAWEERIAKLDEMIEEARAYAGALNAGAQRERAADVRWESLRGVVAGETPVWIQTNDLAQVRAALDWTAKHGLALVLVDGSGRRGGDTWQVGAELAERGVPVILKTTRVPGRRYEPYDLPFAAPAKLAAAGVGIAFGSFGSSNARNLPQEAARAAAYGLPREAAEHALTLGAAEVLGVADRYGSLEPGKSATLILVDGDLLETRMQVRRAWIDGRPVDLESRHTELWKKWSSRPRSAFRDGGPGPDE